MGISQGEGCLGGVRGGEGSGAGETPSGPCITETESEGERRKACSVPESETAETSPGPGTGSPPLYRRVWMDTPVRLPSGALSIRAG